MPIPLRERPRDWFFIVAFSAFALTSFLVDLPVTLDLGPARAWMAEVYGPIDPLSVDPPPFAALAVAISGFVWGPLYLWFVWGFVRGAAVIRTPELVYAGALTAAMLLIVAEELYSPTHASL